MFSPRSTLLLFVLAVISSSLSSICRAEDRPNVVLIVTDNHGAWTLGCYGNDEIRTPHIDRLATEGTLFTRAFASNPVCSPTRATLLTGLVPSQHGVHSFLAGGRLQTGPNARCTLNDFTSLPEVLRDEGYRCGLVGKWHLGGNLTPQEGLDDYWVTMPHGGTSTFYGAQIIENGSQRTEPTYLTDFWTQHAAKFIEQQAQSQLNNETREPFFLYLAYNGPYALSRLLLREGQNRHANYYAGKPLSSFPRTKPHPWQLNNLDFINNPTSIRRVATEVSGVDDGVGVIMKTLRENGLDENTVVIFVADQGWVGGHGGFFGMGDHTRPLTARDGMMQVPLIWRHPQQIRSGQRRDQMIANYDVMPTLLGHLGLGDRMPVEPVSPGRDFSAILHGQSASATNDEPVFYEFENLRCIRTSTHKYVHRHPNGPHELYDLGIDAGEFVNLVGQPEHQELRVQLKAQLDNFYADFSLLKYDMWNGGTSQVRIHRGVDEEYAQLASTRPPEPPEDYRPAPIKVPDGFSVELVAGPPLVTHPTMACFDDAGHLYVCNNSGVNLSNKDLEGQLPNAIHRLVDSDHDGTFDLFTVFADKMTFPMGGVWLDGSLYVASPPNIWKLTDTDNDGIADQREVIVERFGYNGNAASIHGCFLGPAGRLHWTDGYHGHEFKDDMGTVVSQREASYLFSCRPDGSDRRIHCGGGMDNPVEIDFTASGDMLGTVNILHTRPRVDAMVHWLHGGAYPHRPRALDEMKVTGDVLGPMHRFGHVAVSGMTRYRSGVLDHTWGDDLFTTFFNSGKVVRLSLQPVGSTHEAQQYDFLSSPSREFHPTDVLEDADGSLLVIDTGGWFYRGCPTSQYAKPELLGGIYRVRRDGMTTTVDPHGRRIDWAEQSLAELVRRFNDTRFSVRQRAVAECGRRGKELIPLLERTLMKGDIRLRQNSVWALARLAARADSSDREIAAMATSALQVGLLDKRAEVRQSVAYSLGFASQPVNASSVVPLLLDTNAAARRQAATLLGTLGDHTTIESLVEALGADGIDRAEEHAIVYALIEINHPEKIRSILESQQLTQNSEAIRRRLWITMDQIDASMITFDDVKDGLWSEDEATRTAATQIIRRHRQWASQFAQAIQHRVDAGTLEAHLWPATRTVLAAFIDEPEIAVLVGQWLQQDQSSLMSTAAVDAIANSSHRESHPSWTQPLLQRLSDRAPGSLPQVLAAIASLETNEFDQPLMAIANDAILPVAIQMDALATLANRQGPVSEDLFRRLIQHGQSSSPIASSRAIQIIGSSTLSNDQLSRAVGLIQHASPADLRDLLKPFQRQVDAATANSFLASLESADSLLSLAEHEMSDVIKRFPQSTLAQGNRLLDRLKKYEQAKRERLGRLSGNLVNGDASRGKTVFFRESAKCSTCHRVGEQGQRVGPDLTTIGLNRSSADLLESIVFPSASIVRDYAAHKVLTTDGRAFTGIAMNETSRQFDLQQTNGKIIKLQHSDIETMIPSAISIMPSGLDDALKEQDLLDVVAYLAGLR